mgnify:CR=1 FL=1
MISILNAVTGIPEGHSVYTFWAVTPDAAVTDCVKTHFFYREKAGGYPRGYPR